MSIRTLLSSPCYHPHMPRKLDAFVALLAACGSALVGCGHTPFGRLEYTRVQSQAQGTELMYGVYLPPDWDRTTPLPLVVLLHGAGDDARSADREVVVSALDRAIRAGDVPPFVMVTPEGRRGFWVNWHDGSNRWKDWVMREVIPAVRKRFPLVEGPDGLHLVGVSMGGGGGMQLWLEERQHFGSASLLSAPLLREAEARAFVRRYTSAEVVERVFGPQAESRGRDAFTTLESEAALMGSRLLFGAATRDRGNILQSNRDLHRTLKRQGVPHYFLVFEGKHRWTTWAQVFPLVLCLQLTERCSMPLLAGWELTAAAGE